MHGKQVCVSFKDFGGQIQGLAEVLRLDLEANKITLIMRLNRNTVNRYLLLIGQRIAEVCEKEPLFKGEIEIDESYFGARRVKGKRGRGASGKIPPFGILQRGSRVYTGIVPDCASAAPQAIIRGRIDPKSVIHSDGWRGYNGLVDLGYKKHYRIQHWQDQFGKGRNHINGIESFRYFAKARLMKFNGLPSPAFYLHLKESEIQIQLQEAKPLYYLTQTLERETAQLV